MDQNPQNQQLQQLAKPSPNYGHHIAPLRWLLIILATVVVIGAIAVIIILKLAQTTAKPTAINITPSPTPVNETANWKTYTNSILNYSFKYPNTVTVSEDNRDWSQYQIGKPVIITLQKYPSNTELDVDSINIVVTKIPANLAISQAIEGYSGTNSFDYNKVKFRQIQIDNASGVRSISTIPGMFETQAAFVIKDNQLYSFELSYVSEKDSSKYEQIFDQILSTFKFSDQTFSPTCTPRPPCLDNPQAMCDYKEPAGGWCPKTSSADTSNWKMYTDNKLHYSFMYPATYKLDNEGPYTEAVVSPLNPNRKSVEGFENGELKVEFYYEPDTYNGTLNSLLNDLQNHKNYVNGNLEVVKISNVNGYQAVYVNSGNGEAYTFIHNHKQFSIAKYPLTTSRQQEFEKILSSFRFTD